MRFSYRHFGAFRLLLAFLVVFQHFTANSAPGVLRKTMSLYWGGNIAVLVFFCLSGFVIAEAVDCIYFEKPFSFVMNRFIRIVPHFLIAMLISIVLHYMFFSIGTLRVARELVVTSDFRKAFSISDVLLNCIGFLPIPLSQLANYDFLDVAWAVRIEMGFYLTIFLCLSISFLFSWHRASTFAFMGGIAVLIYATSMFGLLPVKMGLVAYFAFGYGLYLAVTGSRVGFWFTCACIPAIALHFVKPSSYINGVPVERDLQADFLILSFLIGMMVVLCYTRIQRFRRADRFLGDMTYPLYMHHTNVLVVLMSVTSGYHYSVYLSGIVFSVFAAYALSATVDPLVNRLRDRVRGRRVDSALGEVPLLNKRNDRVFWMG